MKKNIFSKTNNAFTLLELLVVIGIISILLALGFASYSTAQIKARDTKRRGDLKTAQNVMEQCYSSSATFNYPLITDPLSNGTLTASCTVNGSTVSFSISDPRNSAPNVYSITSSTTTDYEIGAVLETDSSAINVKSQQ